MRITVSMLRELEQAIAPDAEAEILIYPAGFDIRVSWNGGLRMVNQNVASIQMANIDKVRDEQVRAAWDRLIRKFQSLRDHRQGNP